MKALQLCISTVFALLSSLTGAQASEVYVSCEGCSASQASAAASGQAIPNSSLEVYVFNVADENIRKYWVFSTFEQGELFTVTTPQTVESSVQSEFDDWMYVKHYDYNLEVRVTEEDHGIGSAYELFGPNRNAAAEALEQAVIHEHVGVWGASLLFGTFFSKLGKGVKDVLFDDEPYTLDIEFDDGSVVDVVWDWSYEGPRDVDVSVTPVRSTAKDSDGNFIPQDADDARTRTAKFATDATGNSANMDAWIELVQYYQLTVVTGAGGSNFTCSGSCDTSGCTVTCIRN
jgi:major membrane immunogen (membrane-anchored lipoprotein)